MEATCKRFSCLGGLDLDTTNIFLALIFVLDTEHCATL